MDSRSRPRNGVQDPCENEVVGVRALRIFLGYAEAMETVDNREVLASREESISLARSFHMDATPGTKVFSRGVALVRAKSAFLPHQRLIELLEELPEGSQVVVKTKVRKIEGTRVVSYGMSIRLPKEARKDLKEEENDG